MKKVTTWKTKTSKKEFLEKLENDTSKEPIEYNKDNNFDVGDYINHTKFGNGFIQKVISNTKIEVFFIGSERILLQNWPS